MYKNVQRISVVVLMLVVSNQVYAMAHIARAVAEKRMTPAVLGATYGVIGAATAYVCDKQSSAYDNDQKKKLAKRVQSMPAPKTKVTLKPTNN